MPWNYYELQTLVTSCTIKFLGCQYIRPGYIDKAWVSNGWKRDIQLVNSSAPQEKNAHSNKCRSSTGHERHAILLELVLIVIPKRASIALQYCYKLQISREVRDELTSQDLIYRLSLKDENCWWRGFMTLVRRKLRLCASHQHTGIYEQVSSIRLAVRGSMEYY